MTDRVRENLLALLARQGDAAARDELVGILMPDIRRCVGAAVGAHRVREYEGAGVAHVLRQLAAWDYRRADAKDFRVFGLYTLRYRVVELMHRETARGGAWVPRSSWRSERSRAVRETVSLDAPVRRADRHRVRELAAEPGWGSVWGAAWGADPLDALIAAEELATIERDWGGA